jgi:hypothetical protein
VSPSQSLPHVLIPPLPKRIRFTDPTTDSQDTTRADPPAPVEAPVLVDPASNFTGSIQLVPSFPIPSVFSQSGGQQDLTPPHAAFRTLYTARTAAIRQRDEWDTAHAAASLALRQAEAGRELAAGTEHFLTREMVRLLQGVQGDIPMVRIDRFTLDVEAEWAATWNNMATTLPPNLEDSGAEYSEGGYVQPLDAEDVESALESEE